ncbi:MAG: sulfatase-like hydrolase/transferase [SAR324 cluster bacterium]|nr:sulfatase-like hydrolase/transferase [SAR324 cluster bacterium]
MTSFNRILKEIVVIWITLMLLFSLGRLYFFLDFLDPLFFDEFSVGETFRVFLLATRFDSSTASILLGVPFFLTVLILLVKGSLLSRLSLGAYWKFLIVVSSILIIVDHFFFYYYQDHFNVFFWEFWMNWENSKLVIWSLFDELPLLKILVSTGLLIISGLGIFFFVSKIFPPLENFSFLNRRVSVLFWLGLFIVSARGTFGNPLSIYMNTIVSTSHYLNLIHTNPFYSLHASWDKSILRSSEIRQNKNKYIAEAPAAFQLLAGLDQHRSVNRAHEHYTSLDYQVQALGDQYLRERPKHVVLIFMEGFGEWITLMEENQFNETLAGNFLKIKEESLYFDNYFPAGPGTLQNITKAVLGIPTPVDLAMSKSFTELHKPFPSSLAKVMEKLGYRPQFFYGGNLTWHRLSFFLKNAGFQEIYGANHVLDSPKTRFGAFDGDLFRLIDKKLKKADQPTFSFIMTLSNHPPFDLPEDYKAPEIRMPSSVEFKQSNYSLEKRFRAFAYADHALGEFLQNARQAPYFEETLFIITADHSISGSFKWEKEDQYRVKKIPLLLHSPALLKPAPTVISNRGSHLDLSPTLSSLLTARPFSIQSWGRSLLLPPEQDELYSFYMDCLEDICRHLKRNYRIDQKKSLIPCRDRLCLQKAKIIKMRRKAADTTGLHYFFHFEP